MNIKRKYLYAIPAVLVLLIGFEMLSRVLLSPNLVEIEGSPPYLLQTTWHQIGDYAAFVEHDTDAGCWATAIAQIAHFHKLNPSGKINYTTTAGKQIVVELDDFSFDHAQFADHLDAHSGDAAKEQVGKYIYYIAALIYTNFGSSGYIEHETMMERIETHLNCDVGFYEYTKATWLGSQPEIRALIQREIDARRPMMIYFDNGDDFGHATVIDGYVLQNGQFFVHLNMGWGGKHDGWYQPFEKLIGMRDDLQNRFLVTVSPKL